MHKINLRKEKKLRGENVGLSGRKNGELWDWKQRINRTNK